jgi:hypothetical protein
MSFKKGEDPNRAKGGKRPGAGRKTNKQKAEEKLKAEIAEQMLKAEVRAIMNEYIRLAKGGAIKEGSQPSIIKDAVAKWIPPAKQEIDLSTSGERIINYTYTIDANKEFYEEQERRREAENQAELQLKNPGEMK